MELEFSDRGTLGNSRTNLVKGTSQTLHRIKPTPVTVSGISVASTFWLVSSFVLIAGLIVAVGFPDWTSQTYPPSDLAAKDIHVGLFYFCFTPDPPTITGASSSPGSYSEDCSSYIGFSPSNLTSLATIETRDVAYLLTSSVCYGFGTGLLIIALIVGIVAYRKPRIKDQSVFLVAFVIQLFACIFLLISLVLFPLIFNSEFMKQFCGSSAGYYMRGRCSIEWSTQLAMVIVSLTFYLPPFAIFSMNVSDGLRAYNCC